MTDLQAAMSKVLSRHSPLAPPVRSTAGEVLEALQALEEAPSTSACLLRKKSQISKTPQRKFARPTLEKLNGEHFNPSWHSEAGEPLLESLGVLEQTAKLAEEDPTWAVTVEYFLLPPAAPSVRASLSELEDLANQDAQAALEAREKAEQLSGTPPATLPAADNLDKQLHELVGIPFNQRIEAAAGGPNGTVPARWEDAEKIESDAGDVITQDGVAAIKYVHSVADGDTPKDEGKSALEWADTVFKCAARAQALGGLALNTFPKLSEKLKKAIPGMHSEENLFGTLATGALRGAESSIYLAAAVNLAVNGPQAIIDIVNLIAGVPSAEELTRKQLENIETMLQEISKQIAAGFEEVDETLAGIGRTLREDTTLLQNINANVQRLGVDMSHLQNALDRMQSNLFEVAEAQREEGLQEALNTDIGYQNRTPEHQPLPLYNFQQAVGFFYTWAFDNPFNVISENPTRNWARTPDEISQQLEMSGASGTAYQNSLNFNLPFLLHYADAQGSLNPLVPFGVGNPAVWEAGASALAQIVLENPQYQTPGLITDVRNTKQIGEGVANASAELGNQTGINAGPFNASLDQYERAFSRLANALSAHEDRVLSETAPATNNKLCPESECKLGKAPPGGEAFINLWETFPPLADQPPSGHLPAAPTSSPPGSNITRPPTSRFSPSAN